MPVWKTDFGACVINLDSSRDRRIAMKAEFARAALPWRRVPGVMPTAMPEHLRSFFTDASGRPVESLTPGERGCFAAHLSIMARMVAGELDPVMLVLEDDCALPAGLSDDLRRLIRHLPADWDMVRLCNLPKRAYVPLDRLSSGHALIRYSTIPNFTGAYLVNVAGARKLLAGGPKTIPYDGYLREAWRHGSNVFGVWPPMVTQRHDESCIDRIDEILDAGRAGRAECAARVGIGQRISWQIGALGLSAWLACHVVDLVDAILRRLTCRTVIHRAAPLLERLCRRPRPITPVANDEMSPRPVVLAPRLDAVEA